MSTTADKGDLAKVTGTFKNSSGTLIDPTTVMLKYRTPSGTKTTLTYITNPEINRTSTGIYYAEISMSESGTWFFKYQSTGTGQAASSDYQIIVNESVF